jgi:hypothetical protein
MLLVCRLLWSGLVTTAAATTVGRITTVSACVFIRSTNAKWLQAPAAQVNPTQVATEAGALGLIEEPHVLLGSGV